MTSVVIYRAGEQPPKWYKFDDGEVQECKMDDDEEMKNQCFGGEYLGEVFDHMMKRFFKIIFFLSVIAQHLCAIFPHNLYYPYFISYVSMLVLNRHVKFSPLFDRMSYRRQKRWWNAYILFFERMDGFQEEKEKELTKSMQDLALGNNLVNEVFLSVLFLNTLCATLLQDILFSFEAVIANIRSLQIKIKNTC